MKRVPVPLWLPWMLFAGALIALFGRLLWGDALFWGLPALQFYPWRQYAFEEFAAGRWPSWNPLVGAGAPLIANYQTALFYPPNWLHVLLPDAFAMSAIALAHIVWTFAGMWLFAGALGLSRFGRSISALTFALSGYLIGRVGSFPTADAVAWIPWLFWLTERVLARRRGADVAWLGLAFGMQLLAGHAQTTWYGGVGLGLYALWRVIWGEAGDHSEVPRQNRSERAAAVILVVTGMGLGVLLAGVQLVPTAEYLLRSQRSGGLDYDTATNFSYAPLRLLTLFSPNFYGSPVDGSYLTEGAYFEDAAYIGFLPPVLACVAVGSWFRRRRLLNPAKEFHTVPFWTLLGLIALAFATGRYGSIYRVLFDHVPTFSAFRDPVRWLVLTEFSLSILAGIGVEAWRRGKWIVFWSRLAAAGGTGLIVMGLLAASLVSDTGDELRVLSLGIVVLGAGMVVAALLTLIHPGPDVHVRPGLWAAAVLLCVTIDLVWAGSGLNPTVPAAFYGARAITPPAGRIYWREDTEDRIKYDQFFDLGDYRTAQVDWEAVRASLLPNLNMLDGVPALNNFDPLVPDEHRRYVALIEELGTRAGSLLDAAGVSLVIGDAPRGWAQDDPDMLTSRGRGPAFQSPDSLTDQARGFAYLVPDAVWVSGDNAIEAALRDRGWDPAQTVILAGRPPKDSASDTLTQGTVRVVEQSGSRTVYEVETNGTGYMVIAQTWYPGWSATVDSEPVPVRRANLAFLAVRVSAGSSRITLAYHSRSQRLGLGVSAIGAVGLAFLAWRARRGRSRLVGRG